MLAIVLIGSLLDRLYLLHHIGIYNAPYGDDSKADLISYSLMVSKNSHFALNNLGFDFKTDFQMYSTIF